MKTELEIMRAFELFMVENNPTIATCIKLFKVIDNFIIYKITTIKNLEDSKNAMDTHFAELITKNFPEAK